ncbi:MAG TPA: hypothetical protein VHW23_44875 [Kofleriaceae bacterium]|nr:hypothetical protein [Kofleriaceae bacterium]
MPRRRKRKQADYKPPRPSRSGEVRAGDDSPPRTAPPPSHETPPPSRDARPSANTVPAIDGTPRPVSSNRAARPPDREAARQLRQAEQRVHRADRTIDRLGGTITARSPRGDGDGGATASRSRLRAIWSSSKRAMAGVQNRAALGLARMAIWFRVRARVRSGRRRRRVLAYLAHAQRQTRDERASSALLSVLAERIARAGASDASAAETVAQAERIIAGYQAQRAELETLLVGARARSRRWIHWAAVAEAKGSPELARRARAYLTDRERDEVELQRGVEDCDAGCRRLRDAIEQLQALARRSGAP